ncbi:ferredoxin--NADP reductase [Shewanella schlegeliana]|uniref:ferredoxin--NADP(+) reductase n=1 Tax=Shewanella schlegeliana TaxID=190308 RepID=A0ABS1SVD8_9GAMM|nr:ferredoxin--NADP reductase [Shewanella schlegeliana]MBL4912369.1 ferredoxin--NADP reductase [Shewanella schlegeliana]MCL1108162.1 ferredoxin--NADP reductase [Shewanella schlegeliana]GIU22023.1 ferredoxin--NADP(+) reductase [Shewanella schlegeliana]
MWIEGLVIERRDWNDKLFSLKIKVDIGDFKAGQFIKLSQVIDDKRIGRAYSLVNPPGCGYVEVLAVAVEEGLLSPNLQALKVGDVIDVATKASGFMTLDELPTDEAKGKHLWFLATGTAVGPFISMMDTCEPWETYERLVLAYGVRKVEDLAYLEQLKGYEARYPEQFKLVLSVTREQLNGALTSRIPDAISSGELESKAGLRLNPEESQVMICGNPEMITASQQVLKERGLTKNLRRAPGQVTVERYW